MSSLLSSAVRPLCGLLVAAAIGLSVGPRLSPPVLAGVDTSLSAPEAGAASARQSSQPVLRSIASLRPGDRVLTADAHDRTVHPTAVDPTTWRLVRTEATVELSGRLTDTWQVASLQGPAWLARYGRVGSEVPPPVDLEDLAAPAGIQFVVAAVEPCPEIEQSPGRVVLTTVSHLNAARVDVTVRDALGQVEVIETTGPHKFCRLPRDATEETSLPADVQDMTAHPEWWASAAELVAGDRLPSADSWSEVMSVAEVPGVERVYNLTVEGEHLYRVGHDAVLVHNNDCYLDKFRKQIGKKWGSHKREFEDLGIDTPQGYADLAERIGSSKELLDLPILDKATGGVKEIHRLDGVILLRMKPDRSFISMYRVDVPKGTF